MCKIVGTGTIKLHLKDGSCKILTDVTLIPQLKRNLISFGALESKGCWFKSENGLLHVLKGTKIIMTGKRLNGLYYLEAKTVTGNISNVLDGI